MNRTPSVVYVLPDKMGGTMNVVANLLQYRRPDGFEYHVVLTRNDLSRDTQAGSKLRCDSQTTVDYALPVENLHAVMRRVARAIPTGPGVVVASDLLDLATLSVHDTGRAVVLILHGDHEYYYDLAVKHDRIVHAYVAISQRIYQQLVARLPHREFDIHYIPFGTPLSRGVRTPAAGPLRLVFSGRLENGQKGVFELPAIDARLWALGIDVRWTIIGNGPDGDRLRAMWPESSTVRYLGTLTNAETVALLVEHDVLVLPTRHEGLPVSVLEAMSAGVVPVVSNIESGVPDVVIDRQNGCLPAVSDINAFADTIARLSRDRVMLESLSVAARETVRRRFDVYERTAAYQALYARYAEMYRPLPHDFALPYGSRLDRAWIPNPLVRLIRSTLRGRA